MFDRHGVRPWGVGAPAPPLPSLRRVGHALPVRCRRSEAQRSRAKERALRAHSHLPISPCLMPPRWTPWCAALLENRGREGGEGEGELSNADHTSSNAKYQHVFVSPFCFVLQTACEKCEPFLFLPTKNIKEKKRNACGREPRYAARHAAAPRPASGRTTPALWWRLRQSSSPSAQAGGRTSSGTSTPPPPPPRHLRVQTLTHTQTHLSQMHRLQLARTLRPVKSLRPARYTLGGNDFANQDYQACSRKAQSLAQQFNCTATLFEIVTQCTRSLLEHYWKARPARS